MQISNVMMNVCSKVPFCEGLTTGINDYPKTAILMSLVAVYLVAVIYDTKRCGITISFGPKPEPEPDLATRVKSLVAEKTYLLFYGATNPDVFFLSNDCRYPHFKDGVHYDSTTDFLKAGVASYPTSINPSENVENIKRELFSVLKDKFKDGSLRSALLATGRVFLVHHAPSTGEDAFMTDDFDGTGENMLGRALMEIRRTLGGAGVVERPRELDVFYRTLSSE